MVVEVDEAVDWPLALLVLYHCAGHRVHSFLQDLALHGVVECFEADVFELVLSGEVAHRPNVVNSSGLLEAEAWFLEGLYLDAESFAPEPEEILLASSALIDHELEHVLVPASEAVPQELQAMAMSHEQVRTLPIKIQNPANAAYIIPLINCRIFVLLQNPCLHLACVVNFQYNFEQRQHCCYFLGLVPLALAGAGD